MTSYGLARTVSNIQDCQGDSQLSTLELMFDSRENHMTSLNSTLKPK